MATEEEDEEQQQLNTTMNIVNSIAGNSFEPRNKSLFEHISVSILRVPFQHPLRFVSTLIQFGYEPYPPVRHYSFIAHQYLYYYPGLLSYARKIINERGWKALYRGIGPVLIEEVIFGVATDFIKPYVMSSVDCLPLQEVPGLTADETPDTLDNITTTRATLVRGLKMFLVMSISGSLIEIVVRPFRVISLRTMAQHVGEETLYNGFMSTVSQIYSEEGIRGFYCGLTPAIVHQLLAALMYEGIVIALEEIAKLIPSAIVSSSLAILKGPFANYVTRSYTYPFILVGSLMAINTTPLKAAKLNPPFTNWKSGWNILKANGSLFRGSAVWMPRFAHSDPRNRV